MEYILELRKLVGHRPLLMIGAATLIIDTDGRLLLIKRSDNGCWGLPGGGVEPGEKIDMSARRETLEETGLELGEMRLLNVYSGPEIYYRYPNGDEIYGVVIAYLAKDWHGEIHLNEEHTEWRWFAPAEIPENISPPLIPVIENFKQGDCIP
jgi:8-oxo-dGTP pyrophosphatase MutT (NUDIX family)